jgi:hypothetical protein
MAGVGASGIGRLSKMAPNVGQGRRFHRGSPQEYRGVLQRLEPINTLEAGGFQSSNALTLEAAHALLDQDEEVIVSFVRANNDLREMRANTFASRYLMPPVFLQHIPEPRQWTTDKAIHWANALKVSTVALAIALSEAGFIDNATRQVIRGVRVPRDMKEGPELPATLSPRSRERKEALLQQGLSNYYVRLCFEAYREGLVSAARVTEMLLLDGEPALRELAELYGESLQYGA